MLKLGFPKGKSNPKPYKLKIIRESYVIQNLFRTVIVFIFFNTAEFILETVFEYRGPVFHTHGEFSVAESGTLLLHTDSEKGGDLILNQPFNITGRYVYM